MIGGSSLGGSWEFISLPPCPCRLWSPPSLLFNECQGIFPGGKAAEAWSWPLRSSMRGAVPAHPNTPSWRGAQLRKHRDNFTFTFIVWYSYEPIHMKLLNHISILKLPTCCVSFGLPESLLCFRCCCLLMFGVTFPYIYNHRLKGSLFATFLYKIIFLQLLRMS
jgi:hypothetical protein